ncbi:hypothetical protein B0H13DRAFT_1908588 [Mycena leptocephala]|nr:hypothetical protein B0H13DRAFT_1908588 [Mycena leptocephala]
MDELMETSSESGSDTSSAEDVGHGTVETPEGTGDGIALEATGAMSLADRLRGALASASAAAAASTAMRDVASAILERFDLRFNEIRLMQTATGKGEGSKKDSASSVTLKKEGRIGKVWELRHLVTGKKINVIESLTDNPLHSVLHFRLRRLGRKKILAWICEHSDGRPMHHYTESAPFEGRIEEPSVVCRFRGRRGNSDAKQMKISAWTLGGSGCTSGIMSRAGPESTEYTMDTVLSHWKDQMEWYNESDTAPKDFVLLADLV